MVTFFYRFPPGLSPRLHRDLYGNPHSKTHSYGWESETAVETARKHVADLIGASPKEIVFTSGATESNNLAIKGVGEFYRKRRNHIVTTVTEHKCVLDASRTLEHRIGADGEPEFSVTYLPVSSKGLIDLAQLEEAIRPETALVSVMAVNNEIGVMQPISEIGAICRKKGTFFHTDAAQAVGKVPIDVKAMNIDLLSISGHKLYAPKGVGALYVGRKPRVRLAPLINGGGQERGLRSGTLAPSLVVGLGEACRLGMRDMELDRAHAERMFRILYDGLRERVPDIAVNGDLDKRWWGCLNISFAYVEGESLLMGAKDVAVSSGSACTSASLEPSYVLRALGVEDEMAHTSIRFGIGRFTTEAEVRYVVDTISREVTKLREMSPLWEMAQEGIDLKSIQWSGH